MFYLFIIFIQTITMAKRLVKSRDKMLFGVCGGLGNYLGIDATLIRLAFVVAFFGFGTGFLVYLVLAIIMPKADSY